MTHDGHYVCPMCLEYNIWMLSTFIPPDEPPTPHVAPSIMRSADLLRRTPFIFPFEERVRVRHCTLIMCDYYLVHVAWTSPVNEVFVGVIQPTKLPW